MKYKIKTIYLKLIPSLFIAICLLSFNENLRAQPGTIDSSFGENGKVITSAIYANCTALQKDGKIILAGASYGIALMRYFANGSIDSSFGTNGKIVTNPGLPGADAAAISIQQDGKIIVAGSAYYPIHDGYDLDNYVVVLIRYNTDGSLDNSFGNNGIVISDFGEKDDDAAYCIALQADGRIVVGGNSQSALLVARYLPNGNLDNSFSEDGWLKDEHYGYDIIYSIAVQPDGRIVAGGNADVSPVQKKFILERYLPDGKFDSSFSNDGIVINDIAPGGDEIKSLVLQPDGKIIAAGIAGEPSGDFAIVRYLPDGSFDSSFGTNGKVVTKLGAKSSTGKKLLLQEDKQIILSGTYGEFSSGSPADFANAKYNKDGFLNGHFGDNGYVITDVLSGSFDVLYDALLQPDGKIVVMGYSGPEIGTVLLRYNGEKIESPRFAKLKKWLHHHGVTWEDKPNNKINYYSVERSVNGTGFNEIARIPHSSNAASYQFEDPAPLSGDNYYRLSAVSADGSSVTSNIVLVENNIAAATIKIYPNPAKNNLIIEGLASTGNTKLRITDLYGNNIFKATATGNTHTCNIAALKTGTYIMAIQTGNEIITRKFVKQ